MTQMLLDLIDNEFTNEDGDTTLFNKDGLHIGDVVDHLFSTAEGLEQIKKYQVAVPCVYDGPNIEIYMLIVSWIEADGYLGVYYERIESV